jgi:hypothetical protein
MGPAASGVDKQRKLGTTDNDRANRPVFDAVRLEVIVLIPKPKSPQALPIKHSIYGPPSEDVLQKHLSEAYQTGRTIEVNWTVPQLEMYYQLQVTCDMNGGEPIWTLLKGPPPPPPAMPGELRPRYVPPDPSWTHQTGYVSLIAETCLVESGGTVDDNVSIAESVIGLKGAAVIPGNKTYKPMIFGVTEAAPVYAAAAEQAPQPWLPEPVVDEPTVIPWTAEQMPEEQAAIPWMPEPPPNGDLSMVSAPQLVQAIRAHKMSGCLTFLAEGAHSQGMQLGAQQQGEIFFVGGEPVHAVSPDSSGDNGFIDLIAWQKGKFSLLTSERCEQRTVSGDFETLVNAGKIVSEQLASIQFAGVALESILKRKRTLSSEAEFEQTIFSRGVPVDMAMQKHLYVKADGSASTLQILQGLGLSRAQTISLLYNLVVCDLVTG